MRVSEALEQAVERSLDQLLSLDLIHVVVLYKTEHLREHLKRTFALGPAVLRSGLRKDVGREQYDKQQTHERRANAYPDEPLARSPLLSYIDHIQLQFPAAAV